MRKVLRLLAAAALSLVLVLGVAGWAMFGDLPPIPDGATVGGRATVVKDGYVSAFVVDVGGGRAALVDAGDDPDAAAILAALAARGLAPDAVTDILVTHGHRDHVTGAARFPGARIHALAAEAPLVEGRVGARGPITRWLPVAPTGLRVHDPVEDGARVPLGDLVAEAFALPGHTEGSAAWLVDGVLYLGDAADLTGDGALVSAKWAFTDDPDRALASLRGLAERLAPRRAEVRALACSHTGVATNADALFALAE